jgi:hypothetical protein
VGETGAVDWRIANPLALPPRWCHCRELKAEIKNPDRELAERILDYRERWDLEWLELKPECREEQRLSLVRC